MKKIFPAICLCFLVAFCFIGCDVTELLNKESVNQNLNSLITGEPADEVQMATDGREFFEAQIGEEIPVNARLSATINDAKIYDTLEEAGYSYSDEVCVDKDAHDEASYKNMYGEDCDFDYIMLDLTLIYRSEKRKGELLKGSAEDFFITSSISPYITNISDITGELSEDTGSFIIFDYELVEGGIRYSANRCSSFDMIEGQPLDAKLVFVVPEFYLEKYFEWGVNIAHVLSSNFGDYYKVICEKNANQSAENIIETLPKQIGEVKTGIDGTSFIEAEEGAEMSVNNRLFATVNSIKAYDTLEAAGYSESDEFYPGIIKKTESWLSAEGGDEFKFLVMDVTFLFKDEKHKGEFLNAHRYGFIQSAIISPYILTEKKIFTKTEIERQMLQSVIVDYKAVEGSKQDRLSSFDMIEGQPLNMKIVYMFPKSYLNSAAECGVEMLALEFKDRAPYRIIYNNDKF